tara:strand:+ start:12525 stop:12674 length:150 start_codon:yes stop_codon:yes gene_type:complete
MPQWLLISILLLVVIGTIILVIAMFTEMGTKHKTGSMKSSKTQHKSRKK